MLHLQRPGRTAAAGAALAVTIGLVAAAAPAGATTPAPPPDRLYVDVAGTAGEAAARLSGQARTDALTIASQPIARWFTSGTPAEVQARADAYVDAAAADGSIPVLVAYNVPFRDCSQYSAGGARSTAEYNAWIDGLAAGIGDRDAIVIVEPDGLGIIPFNIDGNGNPEWCQPPEADPATAVTDRYDQLNHAVDALKANPGTKVYLDATHPAWLGVGDITQRLVRAGVARADGWFINASNYVPDNMAQKYSSWISQCLDLATNTWWQAAWCASQYYPASPNDFSTWALSDAAYAQAYADTGRTPDPATMKHGVIDTSRNGQGAWTAPPGKYTDAETWCNPPGRGLGVPPTLETGNPYIDANLWIKVPGESDGKCYRGTGGPLDPERGMEDPAAGVWFPEMARELVANAAVPIALGACKVTHKVTKDWKGHFAGAVVVKNTGSTTIDRWSLQFALTGGQRVTGDLGAKVTQLGPVVTAKGTLVTRIRPGHSVAFAYSGTGGAPLAPAFHLLKGSTCTA